MKRLLVALMPKTEADQDRLALAILATITVVCWFAFPTLAYFLAKALS